MRRAALLLVPIAAALVPLSCFQVGQPLQILLEGGTLPEITLADAQVSLPDASLPDAAAIPLPEASAQPEAAPPDAGTGPVSVTVLSDFGPERGATLVASDGATGATLSTTTTGANGVGTLSVPAGATITVVLGRSYTQLVTFAGVEWGDALTAYDITDSATATLDITGIGTTAPDAGVYPYQYATAGACSGGGPFPTAILLQPGCYAAGALPLLLTATNGQGQDSAYAFEKSTPFAAPADGGDPNVDVSSVPWYTDEGAQTISAVGLPSSLADYVSSAAFIYSEVSSGVVFPNGGYTYSTFADGGATSGTFQTHPRFADFVQSQVSLELGNSSSYWTLARRTAKASGSETFDLSHLTALTAGAGVSIASGKPVVGWSLASPVPGAVGVLVSVFFGTGQWTAVVPPGQNALVAPSLPALSSFSSVQSFNVAVVSGDGIAGYASLRKLAGPMMNPVPLGCNSPGNVLVVPPLPANGDLTITGYGTFPRCG